MSTVCPELFGFTIGPSGCRNSQCVKEVICANLFYLHYARAYTHTNTNNKFVLLTLYTCTHTHTYHLQALLNLLPVWRTVDITATHDALTVSHTDEVSSPWKLSDTWQFWKVFTQVKYVFIQTHANTSSLPPASLSLSLSRSLFLSLYCDPRCVDCVAHWWGIIAKVYTCLHVIAKIHWSGSFYEQTQKLVWS